MGKNYEAVQEFYRQNLGARERELEEEYEAIKRKDASNPQLLALCAACGFPLVRPPVAYTARELRASMEDMREKLEPIFKKYAQAQAAS